METIATETMAVPPPEPERPAAAGPGDWLHRNLFRSPGDALVTVVSAAVVLFAVYRAVRYVVSTGRWEIVRVNLKLFMVGRYPNDELWRISVAIALIAFFVGLVAGFVWRRRIVTGRAEPEHRAVVEAGAGDARATVAADLRRRPPAVADWLGRTVADRAGGDRRRGRRATARAVATGRVRGRSSFSAPSPGSSA